MASNFRHLLSCGTIVLLKLYLNSEIVLVVTVQTLYDAIHQVDQIGQKRQIHQVDQIGQKRQIQANSDCQRHNGTDISCPICIQVCILNTF